jgi:hypothetical protein
VQFSDGASAAERREAKGVLKGPRSIPNHITLLKDQNHSNMSSPSNLRLLRRGDLVRSSASKQVPTKSSTKVMYEASRKDWMPVGLVETRRQAENRTRSESIRARKAPVNPPKKQGKPQSSPIGGLSNDNLATIAVFAVAISRCH